MGGRPKLGPPMKNITICLPDDFITVLKKFENDGLVPSRSEAVRLALRDFLRDEVTLLLTLQKGDVPDAKRENI